jgi:hypothetical protein
MRFTRVAGISTGFPVVAPDDHAVKDVVVDIAQQLLRGSDAASVR